MSYVTLCGGQVLHPAEVGFNPAPGNCPEGTEVTISILEDRQGVIRFTTDGSEPTRESDKFKNPISIDSSMVIRAILYHSDGTKSRIESGTYFVNEPETDWPVVSLSIPPELLFDSIDGIFEIGVENEIIGEGLYGANFWTRREYRMGTEIFWNGDSLIYSSPTGLRLFGGMSRTFPQKSMVIISRLKYGEKRMRHRFFENSKMDKFKYFILRNAGSDWGKAHGRDAIITGLVDDWDIDKQNNRPCHVYLNGKYWGIYYIREKINPYFLASHHKDVSADSIDLFEHQKALKHGTKTHYNNMLSFIEENDMSLDKNYQFLGRLMDVSNFTDYKILQIYIDNVDAGGNIKFWRPRKPGGKWQWVLFDTDWGFGLMKPRAYRENSLEFHTEPEGPDWPNPPWSTFLLRGLLDNTEYREMFLNRFADRLNTTFMPDTVINHINRHQELMRPEMPRQFEKWEHSPKNWEIHHNRMRSFAQKRPAYMWTFLSEKFATGKRVPVKVSAEGRGKVMVNNNLKVSYRQGLEGFYFENVPISIEAIPRLGYEFSHWEGHSEQDPSLVLFLKDKEKIDIKAVFNPIISPFLDTIAFNEISCYHQQAGDWIELANRTPDDVNLSGWIIKNKKNTFTLPECSIPPNGYLVLCRDSSAFHKVFPFIPNVLGNFDFGLDKSKDKLELFSQDGAVVDSFSYRINTPGISFTLDLIDPDLDNSLMENWRVEYGQGTPNQHNIFYWKNLVKSRQTKWVVSGIVGALALIICIGLVARLRG